MSCLIHYSHLRGDLPTLSPDWCKHPAFSNNHMTGIDWIEQCFMSRQT